MSLRSRLSTEPGIEQIVHKSCRLFVWQIHFLQNRPKAGFLAERCVVLCTAKANDKWCVLALSNQSQACP